MYIKTMVKDDGVLKTLELIIAEKSDDSGFTDVQKILTEVIEFGTIVKNENLRMSTDEIQALISGYDIRKGEYIIDKAALVAQIDPVLVIEKEPVKDDIPVDVIAVDAIEIKP